MFNSTASSLFEQLPYFPTPATIPALSTISFESGAVVSAWQSVLQQFTTFSTLWKTLLILHIAANFKVFPFVYHLRILNAIRFVLRSHRPKNDVTPSQVFQPLITSSKAPLMEIDVFGHKSNSTYFSDVDIARVHLVMTLFGNGIYRYRGSTTMNGLSGKSTSNFTMALGAVSCTFRRELLPYETYDMWSKILTWDEKWFYIITHFVKKGSNVQPGKVTLHTYQQQSDRSGSASSQPSNKESKANEKSPVVATAVSKVVFKDGRKTLAPSYILELSNMLPPGNAEKTSANLPEINREHEEAPGPDADAGNTWSWEKMETERLRGLDVVQHLAQPAAMEEEFTSNVALGRHYDGYGIVGVVTSLANLAGLNPYQVI